MSIFNRKSPFKPVKPDGFEGLGIEGSIAFSNSERSWEETFNLMEILTQTLLQRGYQTKVDNDWIIVNKYIYIHPEILSFQPLDPDGVRTLTSIAICIEKYAPQGLFEFQHSAGDDTCDSLAKGFEGWVDLDLPVLLDAVMDDLVSCTAMDMQLPELDRKTRRALLGPVSHYASRGIEGEENHPFCSCCLLTNTFEAFQDHLKKDEFFGIRLLALRDENGEVSADCRINGIDWELGKQQLINYGQTWPARGFEMRKQYVVMYTKK